MDGLKRVYPYLCHAMVLNSSQKKTPQFVVNGIWYQQPLKVVELAFTEPAAEKFHITPFKEYWKPSNDEPEE